MNDAKCGSESLLEKQPKHYLQSISNQGCELITYFEILFKLSELLIYGLKTIKLDISSSLDWLGSAWLSLAW